LPAANVSHFDEQDRSGRSGRRFRVRPRPGHGAHQPGPVHRRSHGGNHHRPGRGGDRHFDRFFEKLPSRAGESRSSSKLVLSKGLDAHTAFEILSIDIADVDLGSNRGARLQIEQAEADKEIARAKAEVRRAAAVATEQEMQAKAQEMRARVIEAEAQIPLAIAEAFRAGRLGVMDYTRYKNVLADTEMRESIAQGQKVDETPR